MKKLFLSFLIALGMLLPTVNNTADAASHFAKRNIGATMEGYVLFATSDVEDGVIQKIDVIRLSTGERVILQECGGYECSVNMNGLPRGGYSVKITCQYATVTKQYKL